MDGTRRGFLKAAVTAAGAAATPVHAQGQGEDPGHAQQAVPSDPTLRVKSLESLLVEKGLVDRKALDSLIDTYEHKVGPRNGARVVARAWVDSAYKQRLLTNADAALAELGYSRAFDAWAGGVRWAVIPASRGHGAGGTPAARSGGQRPADGMQPPGTALSSDCARPAEV